MTVTIAITPGHDHPCPGRLVGEVRDREAPRCPRSGWSPPEDVATSSGSSPLGVRVSA